MRVVRVAPDTVYVHADENSSLGMTRDEALALRDLLLREFPVNPVPYKSNDELDRAIAGEPDPDEVRRILDHNPHNNNPVAAAARAWLRSREQRPLSDAEQVYFAACRETERRAAEREHKERRERIATAVLAGLVANPRVIQFWPESDIDEFAQRRAHALIAALDKEQP